LPFGKDSERVGWELEIYLLKRPFFEFQDQWSPDGSINSLGGKPCVGIEQIGFVALIMVY
jgi:hypothetical protein